MKNLFLLILLCVAMQAQAQTAANYYNKGKYLADRADDALKRMKTFNKADNQKIVDLYLKSAENYLNAEKEMPGIQSLARYNASVSKYKAALQQHAAGDDANAYTNLKETTDLWPALDDISERTVTHEKSVSTGGFVYTYPAADVPGNRAVNYFEIRSLLIDVCLKEGKKDESINYARDIADNADSVPQLMWRAAYLVAMKLMNDNQLCDASHYATESITSAARIQPDNEGEGLDAKNAMIDKMAGLIKDADSQGCVSPAELERDVVALASMQGGWKQKTKYAYPLGEKVYNNGGHSFGLIYNEYRLARGHNDPDVSEKWRQRISENGKSFSSEEWRTLADFYYALSFMDARTDALDQAARKERKEHQFYFVSIEPTSLLVGQYAATIGYMGPKASHELRFGYIGNGTKIYLKSGSDTEKVPLYLLSHYHGFQVSYAFKILTKSEAANWWTYLGGEFRYTSRTYTDSLTYFNKVNTLEKTTAYLEPHAQVYDACGIFGGIYKNKNFYMDIFGGVGVGYKGITYNSLFDPANYSIANSPFKAYLWNKIYVPVRVGVRIGLAW